MRHGFGTISDDVIANRRSTSAASIMPVCGMRWVLRELDGPLYDGFQSPAAGPASGRVSPESHDAIATINPWS